MARKGMLAAHSAKSKARALFLIAPAAVLFVASAFAQSARSSAATPDSARHPAVALWQASVPQAASKSPDLTMAVPAGEILRVELSRPFRPASLKEGMELDGTLYRPVYVVDREVLPKGSHLHLVVGNVKKSKMQKKGFAAEMADIQSLGLSRKFDYDVTFRSASVTLPGGQTVPIQASVVQSGEVVEVHARGGEMQVGESTASAAAKAAPGVSKIENIKKNKKELAKTWHPEVTLKLEDPANVPLAATSEVAAAATNAPSLPGQEITVPAGAHARLLLLTGLDAADNHPGDSFKTRVLEPVVQDGHIVLPEGTELIGHVRRVVHPRLMSRPASLFLSLDELVPPGGHETNISADLAGATMKKGSNTKIDSEGGLHAGHQGVKQDLKQVVLAAGVDDVADEAIEAAAHAVAPYAGFGLGLATLLVRHGQDVTLPPYSELDIVFNRPVEIQPGPLPLSDSKGKK